MRARLGFSVAYPVGPDILLIDEMLDVAVDDEELKVKTTQAIHARIRSDKTIVLNSHDPGTIRQLCDRPVWIDEASPVSSFRSASRRRLPR